MIIITIEEEKTWLRSEKPKADIEFVPSISAENCGSGPSVQFRIRNGSILGRGAHFYTFS